MRSMTKMWICCYTSSCFVMVSAFITLAVLSFVALEPRLYVQELYVPALANSTARYNSTSFNTSIYTDLKFKRVLTFIALSYLDLNITLFYNSNRSSSVGYYVFPGFVQGHKKTVHRKMVVEGMLPWEDAVQRISGGSAVVFTVALATKYRVERCSDDECSYTQATTMVVDADVEVDGSGHKVSKKAIRFR